MEKGDRLLFSGVIKKAACPFFFHLFFFFMDPDYFSWIN